MCQGKPDTVSLTLALALPLAAEALRRNLYM